MNQTKESSVYIIIPVHNRKNITLSCLENLQAIGDLQRYKVIVVDDGSTDGTADAICSLYPTITVLQGDGNLWWTGAIHKGMKYACECGADYFIWLNDDTFPSLNTIPLILAACSQRLNKLVSAQCYDTSNFEHPTYGGQVKNFFSTKLIHTPQEQELECDCMSGNLVCLPRSIVDKIGYPPSAQLPHTLADIVYTWQAKKVGFQLTVLGNATAVCRFNPLEEGWSLSSIPMSDRWKLLSSLKSNLYPPSYWNYCKSFYGLLGIIPFIRVYLNLVLFTIIRWILPLTLIKRLKHIKDTIWL
ncbi:glycosyltransferase family 2 protein [Trichocoleus sp. FACHB-262]|uniref:glycosyltransferase family 2 protein n=1 Tax=Trichocoleus sp. FACHB-262 TaxID=2692869 RepID=UPI001683FE56|nr:glycosyltransferase family 2 protein [Trichocoleus sp. FACHB-262]MBD2124679.1 glycosyltransferase family 2 protein [Trichocoleus sp. FACHB-262]